jgi:hypothetical protein
MMDIAPLLPLLVRLNSLTVAALDPLLSNVLPVLVLQPPLCALWCILVTP